MGEGWLYELKFDGYRVQLHKAGLSSSTYGKNGGDFSRRFPRSLLPPSAYRQDPASLTVN
jgi:ATP-dependent DNA ligase